MNIVIPMAGQGSRFKEAGYDVPKPFIPIHGKPMIEHVIENVEVPGSKFYLLCRLEHIPHLQDTGLCGRKNVAYIPVEHPTEGAACTVLLAEAFINNAEPLIICNCDQYLDYDREGWRHFIAREQAGIMTFQASGNQWSYSLEEHGRVVKVAEKEAISDTATVGLYFFGKGFYFVNGAKRMIEKNIRTRNEFYVCPTFNELVDKITVRNFPVRHMYGLGTPEDFQKNRCHVPGEKVAA
jgi:NDP-sugar pyrophosphorylase family protein